MGTKHLWWWGPSRWSIVQWLVLMVWRKVYNVGNERNDYEYGKEKQKALMLSHQAKTTSAEKGGRVLGTAICVVANRRLAPKMRARCWFHRCMMPEVGSPRVTCIKAQRTEGEHPKSQKYQLWWMHSRDCPKEVTKKILPTASSFILAIKWLYWGQWKDFHSMTNSYGTRPQDCREDEPEQ